MVGFDVSVIFWVRWPTIDFSRGSFEGRIGVYFESIETRCWSSVIRFGVGGKCAGPIVSSLNLAMSRRHHSLFHYTPRTATGTGLCISVVGLVVHYMVKVSWRVSS